MLRICSYFPTFRVFLQVADMYNNQNFNSNAAEGGNDNVCDDFDI